jgi:hypothetical protein
VRALHRARLRLLQLAASLAIVPAALAAFSFVDSASARPVQSHSMVHTCCTPELEQASLIAAAKASGANLVRLDVEVHGIVHWSPYGHWYDFSKLDRVVALARKSRIRILGILSGTPAGMTACPTGTPPEASWKCAPADPDGYARHVVAIMEYAGKGVHAWEFWNEPDLGYMYIGTPQAYGRALGAIYRRSAGRFRITSGGVSDIRGGLPFLRRAIAAGARFDIGNIHLRGTGLRRQAKRAARFFGDRPLWVTEHGYPSQPDAQAQVRHLRNSIRALRGGGADQVFVTLRDIDEFGPDSPFASEGILGKPAWDLIVGMNRRAHRPGSRRRRALGAFRTWLRSDTGARQRQAGHSSRGGLVRPLPQRPRPVGECLQADIDAREL